MFLHHYQVVTLAKIAPYNPGNQRTPDLMSRSALFGRTIMVLSFIPVRVVNTFSLRTHRIAKQLSSRSLVSMSSERMAAFHRAVEQCNTVPASFGPTVSTFRAMKGTISLQLNHCSIYHATAVHSAECPLSLPARFHFWLKASLWGRSGLRQQ